MSSAKLYDLWVLMDPASQAGMGDVVAKIKKNDQASIYTKLSPL
jgi:hypothetical protein